MRQASLPLEFAPNYDAKALHRGRFNEQALLWLERWPYHFDRTLLTWLYGPKASGKTHLLDVWAKTYKAFWIDTSIVSSVMPRDLAEQSSCFVWDNIDFQEHECWFLDFLNIASEKELYLLVSAYQAPSQCCVSLSDLSSRMKTFHTIAIELPDEQALENILKKMLLDHALILPPRYIDFLLKRIDRSFDALTNWALILADISAQKHKISFDDITKYLP